MAHPDDSHPHRFLWFLFAPLLFAPAVYAASGNCSWPTSKTPMIGDVIVLTHDDRLSPATVARAVDKWRLCENYGADFPSFSDAEPGFRTIHIERAKENSASPSCGLFTGNTITLFRSGTTATGRDFLCPPAYLVLAHELGHVLGLRDIEPDLGCTDHVMALIFEHRQRHVTPEVCRAVGRRWIVAAEREAQIDESGHLAP